MTPLPESPYCRVRARVASIWADGPDEGTNPDWRPAVGERVTLTPSIGEQLLVYDVAGPAPIIVTVERVQCEVDADGWLVHADGRPVFIAPTDDPILSATGWTWTATIKSKTIAFSAPAGGVVDLALFVATPAVDSIEYVSVVQIVADYLTANPPDVAPFVADWLTANPPTAVSDHGALTGLGDDDHPQYHTDARGDARYVGLTDPRLSNARTPTAHTHDDRYYTETETDALLSGKASSTHNHEGVYAPANHNHDGVYAPALGADDNHVTDAEKAALHSHANKTALDAVSGTNTGDQDLSGLATTTALTNGLATKAGTSHTHTAAQVSDATTTGRSVLTAADANAARTAIGAGTSNLAIGTTGTTAAAGNRTATEAAIGMVELATIAEATTGTDTTRVVTPAGVKAVADTKASVSHTHAYADLTGKPTLGTAAATASTDYATAAQGAKSDTALQPATGQAINAQTGTAYTLAASDAGKLVTLTNAAAITLTVPGNVFTPGQRVDVLDLGVARVTFVAGAGMTLSGTPSLVSRAQYSAHSIVFLSATQAIVVGDLT